MKISELKQGDSIEGFFAVQEANLLSTAKGKSYIRMTLTDASGSICGNMWDGTQEIFSSFATGEVVKIRAGIESYKGTLQMKISAVRPAHESEYDSSQFVATTSADIDNLRDELFKAIDKMKDEDYSALMHSFFDDAEILDRFSSAPAAMKNHHAYIGGLLEHTMSLVRIADAFCAATTTPLNRDLLIAGTLLHDIGKIDELGVGTTIDYTDSGKLLGHLTIGAMMVLEHTKEIPGFPVEKRNLVMHMILSHHGKREYGSPVLPAIPEALALHHIDNLDAKTVAARRMIDEDAANDRAWTERSWMLETQLYKGSLPGTAVDEETRRNNDPASQELEMGSLF